MLHVFLYYRSIRIQVYLWRIHARTCHFHFSSTYANPCRFAVTGTRGRESSWMPMMIILTGCQMGLKIKSKIEDFCLMSRSGRYWPSNFTEVSAKLLLSLRASTGCPSSSSFFCLLYSWEKYTLKLSFWKLTSSGWRLVLFVCAAVAESCVFWACIFLLCGCHSVKWVNDDFLWNVREWIYFFLWEAIK